VGGEVHEELGNKEWGGWCFPYGVGPCGDRRWEGYTLISRVYLDM